MTVLLERPAPSASTATRALAGAEARRLWHSPIYWAGAVLATALGVAWSWTRMPTWETFDQNAGMSALVLAAALLMATHLAAGRDRRAGLGRGKRRRRLREARGLARAGDELPLEAAVEQ